MIQGTKASIKLDTGMKLFDIHCHGKVSLLFVFLLLSLVSATVTAVYLLASNNPQNAVSSQTQNSHTQNKFSTSQVNGNLLFTDLSAPQYTITANALSYQGVCNNINRSSQLSVHLHKNSI